MVLFGYNVHDTIVWPRFDTIDWPFEGLLSAVPPVYSGLAASAVSKLRLQWVGRGSLDRRAKPPRNRSDVAQ